LHASSNREIVEPERDFRRGSFWSYALLSKLIQQVRRSCIALLRRCPQPSISFFHVAPHPPKTDKIHLSDQPRGCRVALLCLSFILSTPQHVCLANTLCQFHSPPNAERNAPRTMARAHAFRIAAAARAFHHLLGISWLWNLIL